MEYKTTTGGETTLQFDPFELEAIDNSARAISVHPDILMHTIARLRQANPLAGFEDLLSMATRPKVDAIAAAGLAGPVPRSKQKPLPDDALPAVVQLIQDIQVRLKAANSIQVEAMLLQALATALQTVALIKTFKDIVQAIRGTNSHAGR